MKEQNIQNWIDTYNEFNIKEETFVIENNSIEETATIRYCIHKQTQSVCILKLYDQGSNMLDRVYNMTNTLKKISEFEKTIYQGKAFLTHFGIGILNGHLSMCIQIPNGGSIRNFLRQESNFKFIFQILQDYVNIYSDLISSGMRYNNLKINNLFVHDNRGVYGEVKDEQEDDENNNKKDFKASDIIDLCSCILQILLNFTPNYLDYIHLLDSKLISFFNTFTSTTKQRNEISLFSSFKEIFKDVIDGQNEDSILRVHKLIDSDTKQNKPKEFILEVTEKDNLYDNLTQIGCLEIKRDSFLTVKDLVEVEQFIEEDEKENALNKCFSFTDQSQIIQDSNLYYLIGVIFLDISAEVEDSIIYFEECLKLNPFHYDCINKLINAYDKLQMYSHALKYIHISLKINPQDELKFFQLGSISRKNNELLNAIRAYKTCIKLNPQKSSYLYNIGLAYRLNNNLRMAVYYYKKYLKRSPNDIIVLYSLALAYFHSKQFQNSIYYLIKIKSLDTNHNESELLLQSIRSQIEPNKEFDLT